MSHNGNGSGSNGHGHAVSGTTVRPPQRSVTPALLEVPSRKSEVAFLSSDGLKLHGQLVSFTRLAAVFELYGETVTPRASEILDFFELGVRGRLLYAGKAVVTKTIRASGKVICEVSLAEPNWLPETTAANLAETLEGLQSDFDSFLQTRQSDYTISPQFKTAVADMVSFLSDLRLWLDELSAHIELLPLKQQAEMEQELLGNLGRPIFLSLGTIFQNFEKACGNVAAESRPAHNAYAKQMLHPLTLCSPFMHRTFTKPLGYAGDYEMVRMMTLPPFQGDSLYAKILNSFFLDTPPVLAHRNRLETLTRHLKLETMRVLPRRAKIFNLGCGPAAEIQKFFRDVEWSGETDFTLLDFNDETVAFAQKTLTRIRDEHGRRAGLTVIKKSVAQLLANSAKLAPGSYDMVYCAGLFDYLPDSVCTRLLEVFYELAAPGGLVLASNVDALNPSQYSMEVLMDWYLISRSGGDMMQLIPAGMDKENVRVFSESTGVNVFVTIRKPAFG